jgi:hypothetical protein
MSVNAVAFGVLSGALSQGAGQGNSVLAQLQEGPEGLKNPLEQGFGAIAVKAARKSQEAQESSMFSSGLDRQSFAAGVVTSSLDAVNQNRGQNRSGLAGSYNFQKSVLASAYSGLGSLIQAVV